jgi:hypothetical protein
MLGVHDGDRHDSERVTRREAQMGLQDVRQGRIRYINLFRQGRVSLLDNDESDGRRCETEDDSGKL